MTDTYFHVPPDKVDRIAALYRFNNGGRLQRVRDGERLQLESGLLYSADFPYRKNVYLSGGAGLCSTASDYNRFCQALLNEGILNGRRLLSAESVKMMTRNQLGHTLNDPEDQRKEVEVGFGFGFLVFERVANLQAEEIGNRYSWGGVFSTNFEVVPSGDWILITMIQVAWSEKTEVWSQEFLRRASAAVVD